MAALRCQSALHFWNENSKLVVLFLRETNMHRPANITSSFLLTDFIQHFCYLNKTRQKSIQCICKPLQLYFCKSLNTVEVGKILLWH